MITTTYQVTGMTCSHCETAVRSEVSQLEDVQSIEVSAQTGTLVVNSRTPLEDAQVLSAVDEAGYEAVRVS